MLRRIRGIAGSLLALAVLLAVLISIDTRARVRMMRVATEVSQISWSDVPSALGSVAFDITTELKFQNVFLMSLLASGVVLVFLMLRT